MPSLRPRLLTIIPTFPSLLILSFLSISLYVSLNSKLSNFISEDFETNYEGIEDDSRARIKVQMFKNVLWFGKLWIWGGLGAGLIGTWGVIRTNVTLYRIFAIHTLLTFFLCFFIIISILSLSLLPPSNDLSIYFTEFICNELTSGEMFFSESAPSSNPKFSEVSEEVDAWDGLESSFNLGWGLDNCEERWRGVFGFAGMLGLLILVALGHCAKVIWDGYLVMRDSNNKDMWIDTNSSKYGGLLNSSKEYRILGSHGNHRRNRSRTLDRLQKIQTGRTRSGSGSSLSGGEASNSSRKRSDSGPVSNPKILLLPVGFLPPPPTEKELMKQHYASTSTTASSPTSYVDITPTANSSTSSKGDYLVYAPIPMSMAEAMSLNAQEVIFPTSSSNPSSPTSGNRQRPGNKLPSIVIPEESSTPTTAGGVNKRRERSSRVRSDSSATVVPERVTRGNFILPSYDEVGKGF